MGELLRGMRILLFMTFVTGLVYPLAVTGLAQVMFSGPANGSLVRAGDRVVGSALVAQKFESPKYFWPRPSAVDYNPMPSGGSNLGAISADLKKAVDDRRAKLQAADPGRREPPLDLLFASASGVDPHISPEAAAYQASRVAVARGLAPERVAALVESVIEGRRLRIFGEPVVNVLKLNMELDRLSE